MADRSSIEFTYKGYELTEQQVIEALTGSLSAKAAARKLCMSYTTFKKYAKMYVDPNTGMSLLDKFKNPSGKGINKNMDKQRAQYAPERLFVYGQKATPERIAKLKEIIIENRYLNLMCNKCGYHERRLIDMKPPLLLNFKNKTKSDWRLENLEFVCYNCYFLYVGDPISSKIVNSIESQNINNEVFKDKLHNFHELDEVYLNHLRDLGLDGEGDAISIDLQASEVVDINDEDDLIDLI